MSPRSGGPPPPGQARRSGGRPGEQGQQGLQSAPARRGRGAGANPANRFARLSIEPDPEAVAGEDPAPETVFFEDDSRTLITTNDSPDVGFDASVNPYRGCEHGCISSPSSISFRLRRRADPDQVFFLAGSSCTTSFSCR